MSAAAEDRWLGRPIGERFVLRRLLGHGGMGSVFEAEDTSMRRRVALKLLEPAHGLTGDDARRFVQEARAAARICHPNVVSVYDVDVDYTVGAVFIVQELLKGTDLRAHLATQKGRRLPAEQAVKLLLPIAEALEAAHRAGVVHCDVTPANIIVGEVCKLIDFGLAANAGSSYGAPFGTLRYMPPERARGGAVDPRSDIWSFGAVLYRCLAGRPPYNVRTTTELLAASETDRLVPIDELADVSAELAYVVHRALQSSLDKRFASMSEVVDALRAISTPSHEVGKSGERVIRRVRFGVVLDGRSPTQLAALEELTRAQRPRIALRRFDGYAELIDALADGRVDLAWLPPVAYLRAQRAGAARQVFCIRRAAHRSVLVARAELRSLVGARAAWVSPWSAAGYLVPRALLRSTGVEPDAAFHTQTFYESYEAVLQSLLDGTADVGAFRSMRAPLPRGLKVIAVSNQSLPGDCICASSTLGEAGAALTADRWYQTLADEPAFRALLGASELEDPDPEAYAELEEALSRDTRS